MATKEGSETNTDTKNNNVLPFKARPKTVPPEESHRRLANKFITTEIKIKKYQRGTDEEHGENVTQFTSPEIQRMKNNEEFLKKRGIKPAVSSKTSETEAKIIPISGQKGPSI